MIENPYQLVSALECRDLEILFRSKGKSHLNKKRMRLLFDKKCLGG